MANQQLKFNNLGSLSMLVKLQVKWIGYFCLTLWVLLVFFLYININGANVDYSLKTYLILFSHTRTLLLVLIPCLILVSVAAIIYLAEFLTSKGG